MRATSFDQKALPIINTSPWLVLVAGLFLALFAVSLAAIVLLSPPMGELATLTGALGLTSLLSLAGGYLLYRRGWTRSPSISLTLILTYAWATVLTLFNVWVLARLMFVNSHDLTLAGILMLFAAIIATTFGIFVAASVTDSLRKLGRAANELAQGNLEARAVVSGRDEIAHLGEAFNSMAEQLQTANAKREELEKLRRDFVAWTSHDLRTPLTSIRVMAEALNDGVVEDIVTQKRYYRTMLAEIVSISDLIDDLFELAQIDAGGLVIIKDPQSLSDLISDTLETFRPLAERREISLQGSVAPGLDPVCMNSSKIGRVMSNLVGNAIQHAPDRGFVNIEAERTKEGARVTVYDNGPGFTEEDLKRVFERFYRGEQARSRATGGAGLGLAIAEGFVQAHGGKIWAENQPDGGACVIFVLPTKDCV